MLSLAPIAITLSALGTLPAVLDIFVSISSCHIILSCILISHFFSYVEFHYHIVKKILMSCQVISDMLSWSWFASILSCDSVIDQWTVHFITYNQPLIRTWRKLPSKNLQKWDKTITDTIRNKGYNKNVKIKMKGVKGSVHYREDEFSWKTKLYLPMPACQCHVAPLLI